MKKLTALLLLVALLGMQCSDQLDETEPDKTSYEDAIGSTRDSGDDGTSGTDSLPDAGQITAGEWNDLEHWDFWLDLLQEKKYSEYTDHWGFYPFARYSLNLTDENGHPVADAQIKLKSADGQVLWHTRTDNLGTAEMWPSLYDDTKSGKIIAVTYKQKTYEISAVHSYSNGPVDYQLPVTSTAPQNLDIMFIVDATGSMGDEIDYLKAEISDVLNEVMQTHANLSLRLGAVFYRDEGDDFVTRNFSLSTNLENIINRIEAQKAVGGGDYPEAVDMGLKEGVEKQIWSENAIGRLAFLLLDAPPHHVNQAIDNIKHSINEANKNGVKIIPITASGTDLSTEMLMRFVAISTNGTYVFITDHSGIGGDHLEPSVGDYKVEYLNDLLIRLIKKYSKRPE